MPLLFLLLLKRYYFGFLVYVYYMNTNSAVTTAKDNGIAAINQVQAATTKKSDAKAEIDQCQRLQ
jgi:hypothetical protein